MNHHQEKTKTGEGRPFLAPAPEIARSYQSSDSGITRPVTASVPQLSSLHFLVHPDLPEVQGLATSQGWHEKGFHTLSITWVELHWTVDGWKTKQVLRSTDVPCPMVNGTFFVPNVAAGSEVEFAIHAGIACHAPQDTAGVRESADLWLNNQGLNYHQVTR
jgi:hypothetical protein